MENFLKAKSVVPKSYKAILLTSYTEIFIRGKENSQVNKDTLNLFLDFLLWNFCFF